MRSTHRFTFPCFPYVLSRFVSSLPQRSMAYKYASRVFTLTSLIYATVYAGTVFLSLLGPTLLNIKHAAHPLENCQRHDIAISVLTILSGASSTLLVLLRARAAFNNNLAATTVCAVIWSTHIVLACIAKFAIQEAPAGSLASTGFCRPSGENRFHIAASAVLLVLHAFVCISMSLRLGSGYLSIMSKFEISILGRGLPPFSKGMLRDGQIYFM